MYKVAVFAGYLLIGMCPAVAQTAEETAAFLIANVEDGAKIYVLGKHITLKKEKDDPLTYRGTSTEGAVTEIRTIVKQTSKCVFEVTSHLIARPGYQPKSPNEQVPATSASKFIVNMTKANQLTKPKYGQSVIHGTGECPFDVSDYDANGQRKGQVCVSEMPLPGNVVNGERKQNAFNYLKTSFCRSNAF